MFDFKEGYDYLAIYFVGHDETLPIPQRIDWMAMVWREGPKEPYKLRYRISSHASEGLVAEGAPADERTWYDTTLVDETEDTIVDKMEELVSTLATFNKVAPCCLYVHGDCHKALAMMAAQPWCHVTVMPMEESSNET